MKRNSKKVRDNTAFLYVRLSRDDNLEGESYSISNQKKLLTKAAKDAGYTNIIIFADDGVSGVTMNRPGYQAMIAELEKDHAAAVFVKDMSRLGRNYIEVGRLTEEFLPQHEIRLVAISDGIDTNEGENELAPIRNLFNEWYARDISKKKRISNKVRGNSGEPLGPPPYGYIKDPDDPKHWIIEPEAAAVVRKIYDLFLAGRGTEQICGELEQAGIPTPTAYWREKGIGRGRGSLPKKGPSNWNCASLNRILTNQEYTGDLINFKTYSKSYKLKARLPNDPENWAVFKNAHEAIIDRATWERAQAKRKGIRKRKALDGEVSLFSGLVTCADCGSTMHIHFNQRNHEIRFFNCSNYKGNRGGTCESTHYIRVDFLEQVVLEEIRRLTKYATAYEDQFAEAVMRFSIRNAEADRETQQKNLWALEARDRELDRLFERIYEDNISGKLTNERFARMSERYDTEQKELAEKIKAARKTLEKSSGKTLTKDIFISTVSKYTRVKKLTQTMVNELIDHIEVNQAEKVDGVWEQRLTIHYNVVGPVSIPEDLPLPVPEISVNTRQGVWVNYAASQKK